MHFRALRLLCALFLATPNLIAAEDAPTPPLTIGAVLPLSGGYADWAAQVRRGLEMARSDAKHVFNLEYQDEGPCDSPARSIGALHQLLSARGARFVIVGCLSGTKAIGPLAKQRGVLLMSSGLLDREVISQGLPLINFATEIAGESEHLAELITQSSVRRLAAFRPPDAFGEEVALTLQSILQQRGVATALNEVIAPQELDFRPLLLRAKGARADAIFLNTLGKEQQLTLMRQLRELGLSLPVFGNYVIEANVTTEAERRIFEGVRYTYPLNSAIDSPEKLDFDSRFRAAYGANETPSANTYFVYDGLMLFAQNLKHCPGRDPECMKRTTANGVPRRGLSGDFTILPNGSCKRPYGFKQARGGRFEWMLTPPAAPPFPSPLPP